MKFCQLTFLQTADIHTFVLVIHFCDNFYITFILHVYDMTYEKIGGDGGTDGYRVKRLPIQWPKFKMCVKPLDIFSEGLWRFNVYEHHTTGYLARRP